MRTSWIFAAVVGILIFLLPSNVVPFGPATVALLVSAAGSIGSLGGGASSWISGAGETIIAGKITVENWTKFPMTNPSINLGDGVLNGGRASPIPAGGSVSFEVRKDRFTATGCYGTASWYSNVRGVLTRVAIMWHVPYDYWYYSNYLAVGSPPSNRYPNSMLFDQMYYGMVNATGQGLWFTRKQYWDHISVTTYTSEYIVIQGQMGTGHDADVHARILPLLDSDLADSKKQEAEAGYKK